MLAVVITGPPGAGKTSVLTALADALSDDDVPHAVVEAEALRWAHPGLTDEQEMRHVKAVCALYREAGHALMLIGQTIETDDNLAQLVDAVGADGYAADASQTVKRAKLLLGEKRARVLA